ncbi:SRPBCC family protein [Parenemella sanctibonifatiensis]|uniref:Polyketide cyclase n=1 Tax=Parenemella sanctibonifatiensis TaxID=2016505 RepID=A0A255EKH6_9ACTN|nr:SRPBCC family protein [Parenemella sanctibonifatiensis]OYN92027.1 polyketide cyclase [Parenemella sanctibonifatiensis]
MTGPNSEAPRVVSASRDIAAPAAVIFDLIADPAQQPRWDGNDNLESADPGQRVHAVGDVFVMHNTGGKIRPNNVIAFEEGRLIAWQPAPPGEPVPGHIWRWELEPVSEDRTRVRHVYDWSKLTDERRLQRAADTTEANLLASLDRLADLAETTV